MTPAGAPRRLREQRRRPPGATRGRGSLWLSVALAVAALGFAWSVWRWHERNHVRVVFTAAAAVPPLELTFYPDQLAFQSPSPPDPLGTMRTEGAAAVVVGSDLVPGRGLLRYRGDGIGTGFQHVSLGSAAPPIALRPPVVVTGRVGTAMPDGWFGSHSALQPVLGAEVVVMGGGEHGVELATAHTDEHGRFTLAGFDGQLDALGLRVRAPGFALHHEALGRAAAGAAGGPAIQLQRTELRRGRVVAPPGLSLAGVRVLARGLPGIEAWPAADGEFALDHMPAELEAKVVLHGLPPQWTWIPVHTRRAAAIDVEVVPGSIVRGRVCDARTSRPIAGALVFCGEHDAVRTDADGRYQLVQLTPGDVEVQVQVEPAGRRKADAIARASRRVALRPGAEHDGVDFGVDNR